MALAQIETVAELRANYKAVRARLASLKTWAPPPVVVPPPTPEPVLPFKPVHRESYLPWAAILQAVKAAPVRPRQSRRPYIREIQRAVMAAYDVSLLDLQSDRRLARVVRPRQIAMYLCKTLTLRSLPEIGRWFGGRDHTTVLHAVRKFEAMRLNDAQLDAVLREFEERLRGVSS